MNGRSIFEYLKEETIAEPRPCPYALPRAGHAGRWDMANMETTLIETLDLRAAHKRWTWCYGAAYLSAGSTAAGGFVLLNDEGRAVTLGFDPGYTVAMLVLGGVLAGLAWGIHKRFSLTCLIVFLGIVMLNVVALAFSASGPEKGLIGSCILCIPLFRGIVGVRKLKKAFKQQTTTNTSQPNAAGYSPPADGRLKQER